MIRPYNDDRFGPDDILYRMMETQIFPLIEVDSEIGTVTDEDGNEKTLLHMSCEILPVTVIAVIHSTAFEVKWASGYIYFDEDIESDQRFIRLHDEQTARRLFPILAGVAFTNA